MPPNVRFILDDVTQPWDFAKDSFDFIHVRCLAGSITEWPELLAQAYRYVKDRPNPYMRPRVTLRNFAAISNPVEELNLLKVVPAWSAKMALCPKHHIHISGLSDFSTT